MYPLIRFDIFTLFPEVIEPYIQSSILHKAREGNLVQFDLHNIRDWAADRHHVTDDMPYGGGGGMVMKPEPIFKAVESVFGEASRELRPGLQKAARTRTIHAASACDCLGEVLRLVMASSSELSRVMRRP